MFVVVGSTSSGRALVEDETPRMFLDPPPEQVTHRTAAQERQRLCSFDRLLMNAQIEWALTSDRVCPIHPHRPFPWFRFHAQILHPWVTRSYAQPQSIGGPAIETVGWP